MAGTGRAAVEAGEKSPCAGPRLLVRCALDDCPGEVTIGAVAQLVEHHVRNVGVEGSNPFRSTNELSPGSPVWWGSEVANRSRL